MCGTEVLISFQQRFLLCFPKIEIIKNNKREVDFGKRVLSIFPLSNLPAIRRGLSGKETEHQQGKTQIPQVPKTQEIFKKMKEKKNEEYVQFDVQFPLFSTQSRQKSKLFKPKNKGKLKTRLSMLFLSPVQFCFSLTESKTNEICFLFCFFFYICTYC